MQPLCAVTLSIRCGAGPRQWGTPVPLTLCTPCTGALPRSVLSVSKGETSPTRQHVDRASWPLD